MFVVEVIVKCANDIDGSKINFGTDSEIMLEIHTEVEKFTDKNGNDHIIKTMPVKEITGP
jgi:hypothetical protein